MGRDVRKTVTIVFIDIAGSTTLGARLDPEPLRRLMSRYFETVAGALQRHGGTVEKFIGDAVMAVFGVPVVHEDDALRAVRAVADVREALDDLNIELGHERGVQLQIRTGVNSGEVFTGDPKTSRTLVTGDVVNVAARLEQAAVPGQILIGEGTRRLVRDAVRLESAGTVAVGAEHDSVQAWTLVEVLDRAAGFARRFDSPLVGRAGELAQLRHAFERTVEQRMVHLFTVFGLAGIGKSRLAAELRASVSSRATVLSGRALPYGEGITFWPLAEIVRELGGDEPEATVARLLAREDNGDVVAERIAAAIGRSDAPGSAEETFWAARKLFETLAKQRPLVIVFEDIHWAEPTLLDLIEHVAEWSRDAPILLLCLTRPELLDDRPGWGGGKLNATSILLEPLSEIESEILIQNLLGGADLSDAVRVRIAASAEGNPLFVEQLLAMVAEDGDSDGELDVPPTIQAVLAARLDRLSTLERGVIERASVVGKRFWAGAVAGLTPDDSQASIGGKLQALVRKELLRPDAALVPGEEGYRFRHILIRDAAYNSIPKEMRAELHEAFAEWIIGARSIRLTEIEEIVGYHFEQASLYRRELGPVDDQAIRLAARGSERLGAAGRRALARGDVSAAASLLGRASALLPSDASARIELLAELGGALVVAGEFAQAEKVLTEVIKAGAATGYRQLELRAELERAFLRSLTDPEGSVEELRRLAERSIPELEAMGDDLGLAKAWRRIADVCWMEGRWTEQERALQRAHTYADRAGDEREAAGALMRLAMALYYGPTPVPEAIRRVQETLAKAKGNHVVESTFLVSLAGLHAMVGRFEEARELFARGEAIIEELGFKVWLAGFSLVAGDIEFLAGDFAAAEAHLRRGYRALEGMGERGLLSTVAAELAESLYAQDRNEEAERFATISERLAGRKDVASQIGCRTTRARLLAGQGSLEDGERLAREALELAERTDNLSSQGSALLALAEVLEAAGRNEEAGALLDRGRELFRRKGNLVAVEKARELRDQLRT
jgi:predicted ATPase/class 3 adenylate cyclase